ncbi:hypothetical protein Acsp06_62540 [Actinomycetospora sp. NBRC 106375]|uniref:putative PEP-binding protein n=1 Tax=Actinomycetospora sp. NBRC 106375 TaxID=3032207 RepID=UPI0024A239BF|nr:putative PEP-binding protein [Actinomycetospora sp. NBRC 106375]GLZ50069.1 hypothetical protein Acsp06_62540 [Actinomycetospora sp. NBRC 106375]
MRAALALSGEEATADLLCDFDHVGLVRSEYLFRQDELYPTPTSAQPVLHDYLSATCAAARGAPVWFRTLDVTTREANTLAGVEYRNFDEPFPLMGLRGIRRSMAYPESLEAELGVLADVYREQSTLGVVAPFVSEVDEFIWFRTRVERSVGSGSRVAVMVETPAAVFELEKLVQAGASHVIVGTNDLSSLVSARVRVVGRSTQTSPALERALAQVRDVTARHGATMTIAGYITTGLLASAEAIGADFVAVHYCDLPSLFGDRYANLPELGHVAAIKARTRRAIAALGRPADGNI